MPIDFIDKIQTVTNEVEGNELNETKQQCISRFINYKF